MFNALNDLRQPQVRWDCGTQGLGVLVSDSLMFQRGGPAPIDAHLSHVYGLALPFLKRGMPVTPVQWENLTAPNYLNGFKILLLTYTGQKPLTPEVDQALADWVKQGGVLIVCDDDTDPFLRVREWWNSDGNHYRTPRQHLFEALGAKDQPFQRVEKGSVAWLSENPSHFAADPDAEIRLVETVRKTAGQAGLDWRETNYLLLRRGPYVIAAGIDESLPGAPRELAGRYIDLFDPNLALRRTATLDPGSRHFLLDLDVAKPKDGVVLASACKVIPTGGHGYAIEGIANTPGIILLAADSKPGPVLLGSDELAFDYSPEQKLLWLKFENRAEPRELRVLSSPTSP